MGLNRIGSMELVVIPGKALGKDGRKERGRFNNRKKVTKIKYFVTFFLYLFNFSKSFRVFKFKNISSFI